MQINPVSSAIAFAFTLFLFGCTDAALAPAGKELTAGVVQKEIRKGMSQAAVAEQLGSPNIVNRDSNGRETWIYDRIATTASYSQTDSNAALGGGGSGISGATLLVGIVGGAFGNSTGHTSTSQNTLTVIIKYGPDGTVETFSFHQSRF